MLLHVPRVLTADELAALRKTLAGVPWGDGFGLSHDALCVTRPGCLQRRPEEKRRRRCEPFGSVVYRNNHVKLR